MGAIAAMSAGGTEPFRVTCQRDAPHEGERHRATFSPFPGFADETVVWDDPPPSRRVLVKITTVEERDEALRAIHDFDAEHGWIVPLPGYDHVHRVKPDEQGTGT